jgi:hypothetical protein
LVIRTRRTAADTDRADDLAADRDRDASRSLSAAAFSGAIMFWLGSPRCSAVCAFMRDGSTERIGAPSMRRA